MIRSSPLVTCVQGGSESDDEIDEMPLSRRTVPSSLAARAQRIDSSSSEADDSELSSRESESEPASESE